MSVTTAPQQKPTFSQREESLFRNPNNVRDAKCLRGRIREKQVNIILSGNISSTDYLARLEDRATQLTVFIQKDGRVRPWSNTISQNPSQTARDKASTMIIGITAGRTDEFALHLTSRQDIRKQLQTLQVIRPIIQKMISIQKGREGRSSRQLSQAFKHLKQHIDQLNTLHHSKSVEEYGRKQIRQRCLTVCGLVARLDPANVPDDQRSLIGWATNQTEPESYPEMFKACCRLVATHYQEDQLSGNERSALQWANRKL